MGGGSGRVDRRARCPRGTTTPRNASAPRADANARAARSLLPASGDSARDDESRDIAGRGSRPLGAKKQSVAPPRARSKVKVRRVAETIGRRAFAADHPVGALRGPCNL